MAAGELPHVLLDDELCAVLRISVRTLKRRRRLRAFPIPELPSLDKRHRYARQDVEAFLARKTVLSVVRRRAGAA